ncbi:Fanconi anemia group M protein [Sceloporus undulatus]|uniref:Fanconi anemia group M protein n=1 Tax=Sceloporus undulatus TaxID=8520 RepID=UPI001C4B2516|nr:Fanconi anemia group M protein [Sceloporus undulatus]
MAAGGGGGKGRGRGCPRRQATLFQSWAPREEAAAASEAASSSPSCPGGFIGGAAGQVWLFPGGPGAEWRGYQARAARAALEANTLLCLPTGLGKTLVAAAVALNFYRWFPAGRVLFLAPTKPLVAQQRRAAAALAGIPARHLAQITGGTQIADRKEIWRNKRVFFLTPQIMINDLSRGICPAAEVKCLIIDEAHRALGNYAYCQVVKELCKYTQEFRILALTATPGSDAKAVQQVISNLLISHIELCTEDSPDIQPYSHERQVEKCVVPLGKELVEIQNAYIKVLEAFAGRLIRLRVLSQREIPSLTKYQIILARDQFRKNPPSRFPGMPQGVIEGDFALCISLYHGYELLLQMGMRSLYIFLSGIIGGSKGMTRAKNELGRNEDFVMLYSQLESMFAETSVSSADDSNTTLGTGNKKPFVYSHPKLKKLEEVVVEHFRSWKEHEDEKMPEDKPADTRVMIFSSFRDSVQEIAEMLSQHFPVVRVMTFVGHSTGKGKSTKGFTEKEQLEVVKRFREGGYNTLVSTCVGEEGLDIGEVDLIICFDAQKSPIRLVQRMGRTGRKRRGRIVVILSEGREERTYNQSQSNRRSLLKALSENKGLRLYQHSPRMIPEGINPQMHRMVIMPTEDEPESSQNSSKERKGDTLLQKWLPYSTGAASKHFPGGKQHHPSEDWGLTTEEFERWNRLYKIEPGDGIKKPIMPQSHFETLGDEERQTESPAEEVHELSLTEWRLAESPFPDFLVDHSDRCRHFISIMDMIEQMRHEEGDCSYEQKIQPYFHWEDVDISDVQRKKNCHDAEIAQKISLSQKTGVDVSRAKCCSSSLEELDAECISLFKASSFKSVNRAQGLSAGTAAHATETFGPSDSFSAGTSLPLVDNSRDQRLPEENKENVDQPTRMSTLQRGKANHKNEGSREVQCHPEEEWSSQNKDGVDSGYGRFAEENSPLSSPLFYLPASETDFFVASGTNTDEDPSWQEDILMNVAKLLSQSPPSLKEIFDFEGKRDGEGQQIGSMQKCVSSLSVGSFPPENLVSLKNLPSAPRSISGHSGAHALRSLSCPLETSHASEPSVSKISDLDWDEVFEISSEEQMEMQERKLPVTECGLKMNSLGKEVEGEPQGMCIKPWKNMSPDQGTVLSLEGECLAENKYSPDGKGKKPSVFSDLCSQINNEWPPMDEHVPVIQVEPAKSLVFHKKETLEAAGDVDLVLEREPQHHKDLYDASQELFSINFDLGFSVQESEDEILEQVNTGKDGRSYDAAAHSTGAKASPLQNIARKSPSTGSNGYFDQTKFSTPLHLPNQNSALPTFENVIPITSPLTPAGQKQFPSLGSARPVFSTPTGRGVAPLRGTLVGPFTRTIEGSPPVLMPSQAKSSIVKVLANSAFLGESCASQAKEKAENKSLNGPNVLSAQGASSESEEEIVFLGKNKRKRTILTSPENNDNDFESPIHAVKKRRHPLIALDLSDDDESTNLSEKQNQLLGDAKSWSKSPVQGVKRQKRKGSAVPEHVARCFIDEEAELSEDEAMEISSDESVSSQDELSSSLAQFLNDETEITQELNESEMQGVYLKSVRSPAVGNRYKMVHKGQHSLAVFSQIPEQDENYLADSFCVEDNEEDNPKSGSTEEEEEELSVNFDLLQEDSFANGRKLYCTRRRKKLKERHKEEEEGQTPPLLPKKLSRVRILEDSSEDEGGVRSERGVTEPTAIIKAKRGAHDIPSLALDTSQDHRPPAPKMQVQLPPESRAHSLLDQKVSLSEELDFRPQCKGPGQREAMTGDHWAPTKLVEKPSEHMSAPASSSLATRLFSGSLKNENALCILADSREIASGPDVISTLKAVHGIKVQVCSLGGCDYIVSNRLAVERKCQAELLSYGHRSKVAQKVQQMKSKFDRICIIVEKERLKAGDTKRVFHRTKQYDGILSAFIRSGIRVLFSSCQEETADLLKELALVEQRKKVAIAVPTEVERHKQDVLRFYLSIPSVGYPLALALCHSFTSIKEVANSSPDKIAACTQVSQQKAEEVYQYLHYGFDAQMLPETIP